MIWVGIITFHLPPIKLQLTDQVSFGLLYDQPFGADAKYSGENAFVSSNGDTVLPQDRLTALRASTIAKNVNSQVVDRATQQAIAMTGSPTPPQAVIDQIATQIRGNANAMALITTGVTQAVDKGIAGANSTLGKGSTEVKVDTQNISMIFGFQPIANLNFFGGGVYPNH